MQANEYSVFLGRGIRVGMIALIGIFGFYSSAAEACSCAGPPYTRDRMRDGLEQAPVVFLGRVESIVPIGEPTGPLQRRVNLVTLTVVEAFQGAEESSTVEIHWHQIGCSPPFEERDTYLVFTGPVEPNGPLYYEGCSIYKYLTTQEDELPYAELFKNAVGEALEFLRDETE